MATWFFAHHADLFFQWNEEVTKCKELGTVIYWQAQKLEEADVYTKSLDMGLGEMGEQGGSD